MKTFLLAVCGVIAMATSGANAQGNAPAPAPFEGTGYSVVYVDVVPGAATKAAAVAALKVYRTQLAGKAGFVDLEVFEQLDRPGHLVQIEAWKDQSALDRQSQTTPEPLLAALETIRSSNIDRRPYKPTLTSESRGTNANTVYVISHVDAAPNPAMPDILKRLAESSRQEDGNLRFDVLQHTLRGNHFTVIEA